MTPPRKSKRTASPKSAPRKKSQARLLVVDDEIDFARMIQKSLTPLGYTVDVAPTATQAIALQRKRPYDLALLDMRMPEMTGIELLQYLKVRDNKMFIIIMTAYGSFALGIESLKQGACDYLAKPFSLAALKKKVGDALKRRTRFLEEQKETVDEW